MTKILIDEAVVTQTLEALEVATTPLAKDRQKVLMAQAALRQALAEAALDKMAETARELGLSYEQDSKNSQVMFKRLEAYEFAIKEYEDALKVAFPEGATGQAFHHWNAARKHAGRPYLSYEQKERPEMDEDMREMQQEIDSLLKANMELKADADAWRNFKSKTLLIRTKK